MTTDPTAQQGASSAADLLTAIDVALQRGAHIVAGLPMGQGQPLWQQLDAIHDAVGALHAIEAARAANPYRVFVRERVDAGEWPSRIVGNVREEATIVAIAAVLKADEPPTVQNEGGAG